MIRAFFKKEFMQLRRTYLLLVVILMMAGAGAISVLTIKYMPLLFEMAGMDITSLMGGMTFDATASWASYFPNVQQMGLLPLGILMAMDAGKEFRGQALALMLGRGLPRRAAVWAKVLIGALVWTVACLAGGLVCGLLNQALFGEAIMGGLWASLGYIWLYGILIVVLCVAGCAYMQSISGGLMASGGFLLITILIGFWPKAVHYNPASLASQAPSMLADPSTQWDFWPAAAIAVALAAAAMFVATRRYREKKTTN